MDDGIVGPFDQMEDSFALEKMNFNRFVTLYNVRRLAQAPTKMDVWDTMMLPNNSILHSLNGFDTLVPTDGLPDPTLPLITNEKLAVYLKIATQLASASAQPFGVKEAYSYRPNALSASVGHFFQTHRKYHRILSDRALSTLAGVLTWIDYSPLNEAKVSGTLHLYRKFDIIFRTILDMVVQLGSGKHHYILLPQGEHLFARTIMQRTFKDLSTSTLNSFNHDPSIFPILHILGYVYGKTKELDVKLYKEDLRILGKSDPLFDNLKSTSLLERIPKDLFSSINFIFQKDNKAVVYNLADLDHFADDANFYNKLYRHIMNLRLSHSALPEHLDPDSEEFDTYVAGETSDDAITPSSPVLDPIIAPEIKKTVVAPVVTLEARREDPVVAMPKDNRNFEEKLRTATIEHTAPHLVIEPKKETKRDSLLDTHLKAVINGKPLGELVQTPSLGTITPKHMSFVTSAPEESYKKSTLISLDTAYQDHGYHHDMAKVVGSLAKHGMFISKIEEDKTHTEMDRTTTYRLHLSDLNGKTHHVKFTLPDVDENGIMKLSGNSYRLNRQIANVPICKVNFDRVNLSSYYNKVIVERVQSKRFSYVSEITKLILYLKSQGRLTSSSGVAPLPTKKVSYDYSAIGRNFTAITVGDYHFHFGGDGAPLQDLPRDAQAFIVSLEKDHGIYVGQGPNDGFLFWDTHNHLHLYGDQKTNKLVKSWGSFQQFLVDQLGEDAKASRTPVEWTQASIINQVIPLVYILAYKFGLKTLFGMIKLDYRFYTDKNEIVETPDDISISFSDGTLVFNRYPLSRSMIAGGLAWADLRSVAFRDMSVPDTYSGIFQSKKMTVGVLKGLRGFFDFFVDPITESVLEKMGEPTSFDQLLLKANVMLTDYNAIPSSSVELHRFRLYERFNGILYNEIFARGLQNYRGQTSSKKSFSINPEAVFQKIVQDATVSPNEIINPVHEVKQRANITFTGNSGRTANGFVIKDLIYPKDAMGVISDSVPDSGKVGITSFLTASPRIDDIHGIPKPYKPGDTLEPPQILSIGTMVIPGGTTDDGKRNSYLSIQISHYVPNHDHGETLAVRTGYDAVLPHLSSSVFAVSATDTGIVQSVDDKSKVLKIKYQDKAVPILRTLKIPYFDSAIDSYRHLGTNIGYLIPDTEIAQYPINGVFGLTKNTYGKIVDRLRCETPETIPDKELLRKQHTLVQDLTRGKYKALYYLRMTPIATTKPSDIKSYSFADTHSQNSGSFLLQKRMANVKAGDHVKEGDILIYNSGFFVPDPMTKQVTFKHGVTGMVALIEKASLHEDASEISQDLSRRLKMTPAHQRVVITKRDAVILQIVKQGQHVETPDALCIISDEYLVGNDLDVTLDNLDIVQKLNRQSPPADYTGTIVKIRILYGCDREKLSPSLQDILKGYEKEIRDNFKALNNDPSAKPPERPGWVAPRTRYQGVEFTDTTVILEFMIEETLGVSEGDKLVVSSAAKSVVSYVSDKQHYTESGIPVDMLFSTTSVMQRIISSPISIGIMERNMAKLKDNILDIYFDKK